MEKPKIIGRTKIIPCEECGHGNIVFEPKDATHCIVCGAYYVDRYRKRY